MNWITDAKNKTLETLLGGGQYGRGGIGRAYLEAEKRYRDLESGGLKTLRDIEDTGISTDYNIATQAVTAGDNFGTRAQQRVSDAAKIFGDVIGTEQTMSLQEQKARQDIEDAETLAENERERCAGPERPGGTRVFWRRRPLRGRAIRHAEEEESC